MNLIFKKTLFFLFSFLIFFAPIINSPNFNDSFEFVKIHFIYVVSTIIFFLFLANKIIFLNKFSEKDFNFKSIKYFFTLKNDRYLLLFYIIYFISSLFSYNIYSAFWGSFYSISSNFIFYFYLLILYYILFWVFDKYDFFKFFIISTISATVVCVFGIYQVFFVQHNNSLNRISSFIGQPNWFAQFLLFYICIFLVISINTKKRLIKWIVLFFYFLFLFTFSFTYSISSVLSFAVILIITLRLYPISKINYKNYIVVFFLTFIAFFYSFTLLKYKFTDIFRDLKISSFNLREPILNHQNVTSNHQNVTSNHQNVTSNHQNVTSNHQNVNLISQNANLNISNFSEPKNPYIYSDTFFIRQQIILSSINIFLSNPKFFIIGVGPENFLYYFTLFKSSLYNYSSEWDYIVSKPHNYYLQILIETGFFGILFYIMFIYYLYKNSPKYLKPLLLSFFITNFFSWPASSNLLIFFILASYIKKCLDLKI